MKKKSNGDVFMEIANNAIADASAVRCSIGEYAEGLKAIISELESALEAAKSDLARGLE